MIYNAKRILFSSWFICSCRIILAFIFIYAAIGKIANSQEFADTVAAFKVIPITTVNLFAIVLPWIELVCGVALFIGQFAVSATMLISVMNLIFMTAAASAMARGLSIECGCFTLSSAHSKVGWMLLARDAILILFCILLISQNAGSSVRHAHSPIAGKTKDGLIDEL